jgi:hypothetical protein
MSAICFLSKGPSDHKLRINTSESTIISADDVECFYFLPFTGDNILPYRDII